MMKYHPRLILDKVADQAAYQHSSHTLNTSLGTTFIFKSSKDRSARFSWFSCPPQANQIYNQHVNEDGHCTFFILSPQNSPRLAAPKLVWSYRFAWSGPVSAIAAHPFVKSVRESRMCNIFPKYCNEDVCHIRGFQPLSTGLAMSRASKRSKRAYPRWLSNLTHQAISWSFQGLVDLQQWWFSFEMTWCTMVNHPVQHTLKCVNWKFWILDVHQTLEKKNGQRLCTVACGELIPSPGCQSRKRWVFQTPVATACIHISYIYYKSILPETNIAMENLPFWWYLPGKMRFSWAMLVSGRVYLSHVCASYMHTLKHCIFVYLEG